MVASLGVPIFRVFTVDLAQYKIFPAKFVISDKGGMKRNNR